MVKYCKNCGMPDTRPGIYFDDDGICQGCIYEKQKDTINWNKRWKELESFVDKHLAESPDRMYDCVIAVSGGKDSHYQTYLFAEKLKLRCLLVCVHDNMTHTEVGEYNLNNLAKEFKCDLFVYKMNPEIQKKIMRYTFENYNKPFWVIDRLIYTVPIHLAAEMKIPIVVYGENVSVTRGLKDNRDIPDAWNQIDNTVVSDISVDEITKELNINPLSIPFLLGFNMFHRIRTTPIYTSYFVRWDAYQNYQFAKSRGFKSLNDDPHWNYRWGGFINYWQIDSYGYLMAFYAKYCNLGHSGFTDCICELVRSGHYDYQSGNMIISMFEGMVDMKALEDFCSFLGYDRKEVSRIFGKFLNETKNRLSDSL